MRRELSAGIANSDPTGVEMEQPFITVRQALGGRLGDSLAESGAETRGAADRPEHRAEEADRAAVPPLAAAAPSPNPAYAVVKRLLDIVGASCGLLVLAPLFLVLTLLVRLDSAGPVFHRRRVLLRQRYRDGQSDALATFDAFKFRTMIVNADEVLKSDPQMMREYQKEFKLLRDPRITRTGEHLRKMSLDELPQLMNILLGQMSLVGPRMITEPELVNYELAGPEVAARLLSVKPGLTGLWQVSGRTNISYKERVRLDMEYIENRSLLLDLQILVRTVGCVLRRRGAV